MQYDLRQAVESGSSMETIIEQSLAHRESTTTNTIESIRNMLASEFSTIRSGLLNTSSIDRDRWMWYWMAQQVLDWAMNPDASCSPSDAIERNAPANHFKGFLKRTTLT
ncbi:MAG: hypothetical protein J5I53_02135 [Bradyrhizobiaceae bacterium]|nr:hypothetical protein [Bradyrhizobiaceae bacterium]